MRKSEVTMYYTDWGREGELPAVNVKVYRQTPTREQWESLAGEFPDGREREALAKVRAEWDKLFEDDDTAWTVFEWACEEAREDLSNDATEWIWPDQDVAVEFHGRQGGWACVKGLPDVETWDAIALGKWSRFVKCAEVCRDAVPRSMAWHAVVNVIVPELIDAAENAAYESTH